VNLELLRLAGGLGLFLLGMVIMTDGLRGLAGDALHRVLRRFTHSPSSGAAAGALVTAIVQSSSATTVSAVGFASAGLLSFPSALGIVFGANLGTTITGWMVALLGFKLDLGLAVLPLILVGALLRLFSSGRVAALGYTLAGFGLVFLGIDGLRAGMAALEGFSSPAAFPPDTPWGRLQLVGLGVAVTLVTQSSSAGVATALAALSAGAITFPQAASMVIGMDVGTTATAALATVGASLPGRRTGWAHVIYNLLTGAAAFALLPLFMLALGAVSPGLLEGEPELCLVGFHTAFNGLGVLAVLPLAGPFAALVERLVPERPAPFTERLDRRLLGEPALALRVVTPTLVDLSRQVLDVFGGQLREGAAWRGAERRELLTLAIDEVRQWLSRIDAPRLGSDAEAREAVALHVVDQLRRLVDREAQAERYATVRQVAELHRLGAEVAAALAAPHPSASRLGTLARALTEGRERYRAEVVVHASRDQIPSGDALRQLDAYRWLERSTHHAWRIAHHLDQLGREAAPLPELEPPEPD
jgi:phosphate:Na+ symporter